MTEMETHAMLRTKTVADRIALRGIAVHCNLVGMSQRTLVAQRFVHPEKNPIEAAYTFSLSDGSAV